MEVYVQTEWGEEIKLSVDEPDPADGTFVARFPIDGLVVPAGGTFWIRIVSSEASDRDGLSVRPEFRPLKGRTLDG
jgi:hypothetical protein